MKRTLKKYPKGGPVKPIVVTDPNDPRLKAYNDSLKGSNWTEDKLKKMLSPSGRNLLPNPKVIANKNLIDKVGKEKFNKFMLTEDGIAPENILNFKTDLGTTYSMANYKKPVQPYVYQKPIEGHTFKDVPKVNKPVVKQPVKPSYKDFVKTANPDYLADDYDLEKAYNNLPLSTMQAWAKDPNKNHLPDTYKKPNHPTFSNESMYYKKGMPAVKWEGDKAVPINKPQIPITKPTPVDTTPTQFYQGYRFMNRTGLKPDYYTPNQVDSATQATMKKRTLKKYGNGGSTPKYDVGGLTQLVNKDGTPTQAAGQYANIASTAMNALTATGGEAKGSAIGSGIGTAAGMALNTVVPGLGFIAGPVLGKLGGLAGGMIGGSLDDGPEREAAKLKAQQESIASFNNLQKTYNTQTSNNGLMFAEGGMMTDFNAELELNEQMQLPDGQVAQVDGPSHSEGGVPVALPEGTRIFSDRLKYNGKTFAKTVKPINTKITQLQDQIDNNPTNSKLQQNSLKLLNNQLDYFFNVQETNKQQNNMKRSLKYAKGGLIKYSGLDGRPGIVVDKAYWMNQQLQGNQGFENNQTFNNTDTYNPLELNLSQGVIPQGQTTFNGQGTNFTNPAQVAQDNKYTAANYSSPQNSSKVSLNSPKSGTNYGQYFTPELGQLATAGIGLGLQSRNINKLARPRTLGNVRLADKIANPNLVDYSAQRNQIDQSYLTSSDSATRNLTNSASAQAFKNQANLQRLQGTGESWQNQENTNAGIKNQFLGQRNQAAIQEEMANNEIAKYNNENKFNYDAFKTGQNNQIIGNATSTVGQVFGNRAKYNNDMTTAQILGNSRDNSVNADSIIGTNYEKDYYNSLNDEQKAIHNKQRVNRGLQTFANGGTVQQNYHNNLQTKAVQPQTINNAQIMDDEYSAALAAGKDTYESSVTGLDYKVIKSLPKNEKRALVTDMWREAHGDAPTQKQIESGVKAIEGKKVSSPGAKEIAKNINFDEIWPKGEVSKKEAKQEKPSGWKQVMKEQGAQALDAVGSLGVSAITNPLYHAAGIDLTNYGFPHTDLSPEAVDKKVSNPNEYADAASEAMVGVMGGKLLNMAAPKIARSLTKNAYSKIYNQNAMRDTELAADKYATDASYKAASTNRTKKSLDSYNDRYNTEPTIKKQRLSNIIKSEDEGLQNDMLNYKLNQQEIPSFVNLREAELLKDLAKAKKAGDYKLHAKIMKELQKNKK